LPNLTNLVIFIGFGKRNRLVGTPKKTKLGSEQSFLIMFWQKGVEICQNSI
jgi:hypothetical protein